MSTFKIRLFAVSTALAIGTAFSVHGLSDYQLIKRTDRVGDPSDRPNKFSMYMRPAENIQLKSEAEQRYKDFYARVQQQQEDIARRKGNENK